MYLIYIKFYVVTVDSVTTLPHLFEILRMNRTDTCLWRRYKKLFIRTYILFAYSNFEIPFGNFQDYKRMHITPYKERHMLTVDVLLM